MSRTFLILNLNLVLILSSPLSFGLGEGLISPSSDFTPSSYTSGYTSGHAGAYVGKSCERSHDEYLCMMCNCMREAANEPLEGKKLVGLVVKSRVEHSNWPDDICGVIYQYKQFSWTNLHQDRRSLPRTMSKSMQECAAATDATIKAPGNGMDHYHANYVNPKWARTCNKVTQVGAHIFYNNCGSKKIKRSSRLQGIKRRSIR